MLKKNIFIMYAIACLQGMVFYGPIATLYRQAQGVSVFQITIIESICLALCLLLELPWGVIADKIGYKRTMLVCCFLYLLSKIIFWKATDFSGFLAERILLSVIIAGLSGVDTSLLYLSCSEEKSQHVFGVYNSLQTVGLLFAAIVYSAFIGEDYQQSAWLTVVTYGIAAFLSLFLSEVKNPKGKSVGTGEFLILLKQLVKNKYLILFLIGVALINETHQTITVFLNQLQYVKSGLSATAIGYIYTAITVAGLCSFLSAKFSRKFGCSNLAKSCYMIAIFVCLSLSVTSSALISIGGILLLRVVFSLFQPLQMDLQNRQVFSENRATSLSINAVMIDSVGIGTNITFGALAEGDISFAFFAGAGLCSLGLLFFIIWEHGTKRRFLE